MTRLMIVLALVALAGCVAPTAGPGPEPEYAPGGCGPVYDDAGQLIDVLCI